MAAVLEAALPLFVLLNPFMLWVYLQDMLDGLAPRVARLVLVRGAATAAIVFVGFAWTGDAFVLNFQDTGTCFEESVFDHFVIIPLI
jgi:small neutral amino acid transporter SnatA (MarC family)